MSENLYGSYNGVEISVKLHRDAVGQASLYNPLSNLLSPPISKEIGRDKCYACFRKVEPNYNLLSYTLKLQTNRKHI